ncbi:MAG: CHAT domain-containing protein [Saprospiraceae bacterium]|jgi:CHAT domain-containing protein|nr:CHAT domain-containing protein [Saprospiraceae bacterium]
MKHILAPLILLSLPGFCFGQASYALVSDSLQLAQTMVEKNQPEKALALLANLKTSSSQIQQDDQIKLYNLTGQCHTRLQQHENAALNYEKAVLLSAGNDTLRAFYLHQLGQSRYRLSQFVTATQHVIQARDLYRVLNLQSDNNYSGCLNTLGVLYKAQAKYSEAEKAFQEARQINLRKPGGGENIQYARIINNLADVYCILNRYEQAETFYQTSLRIKEKISGKQSLDYAKTLYNLADFQSNLGRYEQAKVIIREGISIFTTLGEINHPDYLKFLDYLAILTEKTGQFGEAERLYKEALQRRELAGATYGDDYALNLLNIAHFYSNAGKTKEALFYVEKALPLIATIYNNGHPVYGGALATLANIQTQRKEFSQAHKNYLEAIRIVQKSFGKDHIEYFNIQFDYARSLRKSGNKEEAVNIFQKIESIPRQYLRRASRFLSEKELSDKVEEYRAFSNEIYSFLRETPNNSSLSKMAYNAVLFYRGFILGTLQQQRIGMLRARTISDARDELISLHRQLEKELNRPIQEREKTTVLEQKIMKLEAEVSSNLGMLQQENEDVYWEDIKMALGEHAAAVEYLAFSDPAAQDSTFYCALLLDAMVEAPNFVPLCRESEIAAYFSRNVVRKADYVGTIYKYSDRSVKPIGTKSSSIVDLIWHPIQQQLKSTKQLFVVPDGLLHRIALSALPIGLESVISDSMELILLNSTRQVIPQDDRILYYSSKNILVVGGIEYGSAHLEGIANRASNPSSKRQMWDFLAWAEKECGEVANTFTKSGFQAITMKGVLATEAAVTKNMERPEGWRILHFATHGYFNETGIKEENVGFYGNGMINSGLVMAGANEATSASASDNNGLLSAYEISRLDLSKTELVVLSACETGLGDIYEEGVYGLQRALKMAGAEKIIMSLWQVPDRETKDFMVSFYKHWLEQKTSIRQAFQATQSEFRERFIHPYLWAGFILLE